MLLRLAALAALGYAGYKYLGGEKAKDARQGSGEPTLALAGGPLSSQARLQHAGDEPSRDWPKLDKTEPDSADANH